MRYRKVLSSCQIALLCNFGFALLVLAVFGVQVAFADPLPNPAKISASIGYVGDEDTYTFTVNAGETIQIRMADTSVTGDLRPYLALYSPSGAYIAQGTGAFFDPVAGFSYTASETGTYRVVAADYYSANTGSYNLYFARMPGANEHGALVNNGVYAGQIDLGDLDTYTFVANAGDTVQVQMTDTSVTGELTPILNLYSPSGEPIALGGSSYGDPVASFTYIAAETGTYTVLAASRYFPNIGSYELAFQTDGVVAEPVPALSLWGLVALSALLMWIGGRRIGHKK